MITFKELQIDYTEEQQGIVDRYLEATKLHPEDRLPLSKVLGMRGLIPKQRNDKDMLRKCERDTLDEPIGVVRRPKRHIDNRFINSVLRRYEFYIDAKRQFYWLDDILVGVSFMDMGGNTRPLGIGLLYTFMSTSETINTSIIQNYCDVGARQAQKIMLALVVCHRMIEKELHRMGFVLE